VSIKKKYFYNIILSRIIQCNYNCGDIITEKSLVDEFEVSKSPIREALIELCNEGFLKSIPRFGYEIISFSKDHIFQLTEYRTILECGYLAKHWEHITSENIKSLKDLLAENYKERDKRAALEHWEHNTEFHLKLISFFGNDYVYNQLKSAMQYLGVAYAQAYWINLHMENIVSECECHKRFIQLLESNKKEEAIACLHQDIQNFSIIESQNK
jgi:DNA-binding GntR family transcriptional regulator